MLQKMLNAIAQMLNGIAPGRDPHLLPTSITPGDAIARVCALPCVRPQDPSPGVFLFRLSVSPTSTVAPPEALAPWAWHNVAQSVSLSVEIRRSDHLFPGEPGRRRG